MSTHEEVAKQMVDQLGDMVAEQHTAKLLYIHTDIEAEKKGIVSILWCFHCGEFPLHAFVSNTVH